MMTSILRSSSLIILIAAPVFFQSGCGDSEKNAAQLLEEKQLQVSVDDYLKAARAGDLESLKLFQDAGIEVDAADSRGNTALMLSSAGGRVEAVEALLKQGADPRLANDSGRTALIAAADSGSVEVARLLLNRGADITAKDVEGWNAINVAAYNGHAEAVELLAGKVDQESVDSALLVACFKGDTAVIDQLLSHGADVNTRSPSQQTPLMIAAQEGHGDAVALLLQNQANPFALDENEETAANMAEASGNNDLRDFLLDPAAGVQSDHPEDVNNETEVTKALEALAGGNGDVLGDVPENGGRPMAALDGAVIKNEGGAKSLQLDSYREKPLPVMLKGVTADSAEVRVLSRTDSKPITVRPGEVIPNTTLKVTQVSNKFVNSKQGKGEMVDVSRITVEDTESGSKHMLVKDVPGRATDTYAVLTMPGSSYRYLVKTGDVFRAVTPADGEQDYEILEIRPTQVIMKNVSSEEVLTINRDGLAMQ